MGESSRLNPKDAVLVQPALEHIADYKAALETGWSPNNVRPEAAEEQLQRLAQDPVAFLNQLEDPEAKGGDVELKDGTKVARLPSIRRWIWVDGFCGTIGLRWQKGTSDLPDTALGHVGYAVVPWRRNEGLATAALIEIKPVARSIGLSQMDVTVDPENLASRRVIEKAGGVFIQEFERPAGQGGGLDHLYRIQL